jgi:hypothetical protein
MLFDAGGESTTVCVSVSVGISVSVGTGVSVRVGSRVGVEVSVLGKVEVAVSAGKMTGSVSVGRGKGVSLGGSV